MREKIISRGQAWCQPVSATSFCGEPSRHQDAYQNLLAEIEKIEGPKGTPCDWRAVSKNADVVLKQYSKDMMVLSYLCAALLKLDGVTGLAAGLFAYRFLYETHGKEMFPVEKRLRGRAGAYVWLCSFLEKDIPTINPDPAQHDAFNFALEEFNKLDEMLSSALGEMAPITRLIKQAFSDLCEKSQAKEPVAPKKAETPPQENKSEGAQKPVPQPAPNAQEVAPAKTAAPPSPQVEQAPLSVPDKIENVEQAEKTLSALVANANKLIEFYGKNTATQGFSRHLSDLLPQLKSTSDERALSDQKLALVVEWLKQAALFYLKDPASALGYHLAHLAARLFVVPDGRKAPPAEPNPQMQNVIQNALENGAYKDVVSALPAILAEGTLSLNVSCALAQALSELGQNFNAACATVTAHALGLFVQMEKLSLVNDENRNWLANIFKKWAPSDEEAEKMARAERQVPESASAEKALLDKLAEEAKKEARRHGLESGCQIYQDALKTVGTKPLHFKMRLALAKLCLEYGAEEIARPLLSDLNQELSEPLGHWEKDLLVEVAVSTLAANRKLLTKLGAGSEKAQTILQESEDMLLLLARIDPKTAFLEVAKNRT